MIRIDLKVNDGWRFDFCKEIKVPFLHLKKIWAMDKDCYGQRAIELAHSKYSWASGMVRTELDRFEKGIVTSEEFQKEFDAKWKQYAEEYEKENDGEKVEESDWYQYVSRRDDDKICHGEKFKKSEYSKIRKLTKEVEKFTNAFTKALVEVTDCTEEEASKLVAATREKLIKCHHFGFENLIDSFWFKVDEDVVVFVENELACTHAKEPEMVANAKAMLMN